MLHKDWYKELVEGNTTTMERLEEAKKLGPRGAAFNPEPVIPFMKNLYDDEESEGEGESTEGAKADSGEAKDAGGEPEAAEKDGGDDASSDA